MRAQPARTSLVPALGEIIAWRNLFWALSDAMAANPILIGGVNAIALIVAVANIAIAEAIATRRFSPLGALAAIVDPSDAASLWARYLTDWTLWNHVRTVSSTAACALFIAAIAARYSPC